MSLDDATEDAKGRAALSDDAIDQLLADGQPGGPALEAVWARVKGDLNAATQAEASGSLWQRLGTRFGVAVAGLAVAAAVVFAVALPGGNDGLRARGGDSDGPVLEATCGSSANPCRVGEPVFLRLHGAESAHQVKLELVTARGRVDLAGGLPVSADQTLAVPRKIRPEVSDIESGVIIDVTATPEGGAPPIRFRLTLQVRE